MNKRRKLFETFMPLYNSRMSLARDEECIEEYRDQMVQSFWKVYQQGWNDRKVTEYKRAYGADNGLGGCYTDSR